MKTFAGASSHKIVLETIMGEHFFLGSIVIDFLGDFNTDFLNAYDAKCKENAFYEKYTDAHPKALGKIGTCLVEENCRSEKVATPANLRETLIKCDEKVKLQLVYQKGHTMENLLAIFSMLLPF